MQVNPGELNKRIEILRHRENTVFDDEGYPIDCGTEIVRKPMAKFSRTSGTESVKAGKELTDIKCRFLVRHTKIEINESMFIRYRGNIYDIEYINDYEDKHEYDEIWCTRRDVDGSV